MKAEGQFLVSNKADATGLSLRISTIEKWLPTLATLWFFVSLDSIVVWNPFSSVIHLFAAFSIIWGTMVVKPLDLSRKRRFLSLFILIYSLFYIVTQSENLGFFVKRLCVWFPFVFILFWEKDLLSKTYECLRKFILFFAIGAAIVSMLSFAGLIGRIPHFTLPPQEALHERLGYVYYVYGLFVTIQDPLQVTAFRACGMMKEPGHFAVILGFVYMIDRYQERRINWWIIICGVLTFSANFILFVLFTELRLAFQLRKVIKSTKWVPVIFLGAYLVYVSLPVSYQDQIYNLAYGRNLEKIIEATSESSSFDDALDERANNLPLMVYNRMSFSERILGIGRFDTAYCLSDYRGMIMTIGWVGLLLSVFITIIIIRGVRKDLALSLFMAYSLVLMHRSWMLFWPYVYFLSSLTISIIPSRQQLNIEPLQSYGG
ncbi:MAG: hypothetical protein J6T43_07770 [Prevotella sp.]|nr:hypothetical protein [Prevotella sp.]